MYVKLRLMAILLWMLCASASVRADVAEDQYAVAALHYSRSRWQMAVDEFAKFLQNHPQHDRAGQVVFYLAESHVQLKQYGAAHERYREYLARSAEGKFARQALFRLGETRYLGGDSAAARADLERFVAQYPADTLSAYAYPYLGEIALAADEPARAQQAFEQGLQKFPTGPMAQQCRFGLARALERQGDAAGAIRFYEFLGGSDQRTAVSDDALLQMAILLYQQQRYGEAIETLNRHRQQYPGSEMAAHAAYWLGMSQVAGGHLKEAADILSSAANQYQTHELAPAMLLAAADAYRGLHNVTLARQYYERLLQQHPHNSWADDALQVLVQLAWDEGDVAQAATLSDRFLRDYSTSSLAPLVSQLAARVALKQGRYQRVVELLKPLVEQPADAEPHVAAAPGQEIPLPTILDNRAAAQINTTTARYYLALGLIGLQRWAEALTQLELLRDVSEPAELVSGVHVARATCLTAMERFEEAIAALHRYLTLAPEGPDAEKCRAQLGVTCARLEQWPEAERVFRQMQRQHDDLPLYLNSLRYMAETAYGHGQRELAAQLFRELARDGHPAEFVAQGISGLAWLEFNAAGLAGSAQQFQRLLDRYPDSPLAAEAAMMRGQALEQMGRLDGAATMYQLVLERYQQSDHVSTATLAAARVLDALQRDAEAEPLLRQWLANHPQSPRRPDALYQLAWVLVDLGRQSEADEVFRQIHQQCQDCRYWADATYRLAERAARADDYQQADELAGEIIQRGEQPPMVAYALYLRGQLAAARQQWPQVIPPLETLLKDHPDSTHCLPAKYWLAEAQFRLRQYDASGKLFAELAQQTLDRPEPWVAMVLLRRAQVLAHERRWDEAYQAAVGIGDRFPRFAQQHEVDYLVGRYHASCAEFDQAREAYRRVIRSETGRGTETAAVSQWMIGETYFMQKQYNQAIEAYFLVEGLYDYPRWQAAALLQAGKCHEMVGRWSDAVDLYGRVVHEFAQTNVAQKAANRLRVAQQRAALMKTR